MKKLLTRVPICENICMRIVSLILFFLFATAVHAENVTTALRDTYRVTPDSSAVQVERTITLTNTQSDRYINQYSLSFSNNQNMENIRVYEDGAEIPATITRDKNKLRIVIPITKPAIGVDAVKRLHIAYTLKGSVDEFGLYKELIMPLSSWGSGDGVTSYTVRVESQLPLSIAKPQPTFRSDSAYEWDGKVVSGNIMVGMGPVGRYEAELLYELKNPYPYPITTTIPLPPDGAYQQSIIESIEPSPRSISLDAHDNVLASYTITPRSTLQVTYKGIIELKPSVRPEVLAYQRSKYTQTELSKYLTAQKYWKIGSPVGATTPKEIYDYVINKLTYDDSRVERDLKRMGAQWAISNPDRAVCTEYTDLFIAQSRAVGWPSRKVIGYAVERDSALQPVSFYGDILHAWPEYYDRAREIWHPIDPTWGDTARLDYFSSFDMNHIAFVYHASDTEGLMPPGVYKSNESAKNVYVKPITREPQISGTLSSEIPQRIFGSRRTPYVTIRFTSTYPTVQYVPVSIDTDQEYNKTIAVAPQSTSTVIIPLDKLPSRGLTIYVNGEKKGTTRFIPLWHFLAKFAGLVHE